MDFHEGDVSFSMLLAIYQHGWAHYLHWSVRFVLHLIDLIYFVDQTGGILSKTECRKLFHASGSS